jgi:hypothetical protein
VRQSQAGPGQQAKVGGLAFAQQTERHRELGAQERLVLGVTVFIWKSSPSSGNPL